MRTTLNDLHIARRKIRSARVRARQLQIFMLSQNQPFIQDWVLKEYGSRTSRSAVRTAVETLCRQGLIARVGVGVYVKRGVDYSEREVERLRRPTADYLLKIIRGHYPKAVPTQHLLNTLGWGQPKLYQHLGALRKAGLVVRSGARPGARAGWLACPDAMPPS